MIVGGRPGPRRKPAKEMGLVDAIIEGDLLEGAIAFATSVASKRPATAGTRSHGERRPVEDPAGALRRRKERRERKRSRGAAGPARCVDAVQGRRSSCRSRRASSRREGSFRRRSIRSSRARCAMCSLAERKAAKIPDIGSGRAGASREEGGRPRRGHHGRRDRHGVRQRRPLRRAPRPRTAVRGQGARHHPEQLRARPSRRAALSQAENGRSHGARITGTTNWDASVRRRSRHRGPSSRRWDSRRRFFGPPGFDLQEERDPGDEHLDPRRRSDRRGGRRGRSRSLACHFFQPRERHAPPGDRPGQERRASPWSRRA